MRVLVTGASGFIGRAVVRELLATGHQVTTLQRGQPPAEAQGYPAISAEIDDAAARDAAAAADGIVHLAGRGNVNESWLAPADYLRVVTGGTLAVLEGARRGGAAVVLASTQRVYRPAYHPLVESGPVEPSDPYALAKLTAEGFLRLYAERYRLAARSVRLFTVYGPGQQGQGNSGVAAIFLRQARDGQDLRVDAGPRRDLTFVDDAARGLCLALDRASRGFRVYNIATGTGTPLNVLAEKVVRLTGSRSRVVVTGQPWTGGDLVADLRRARQELAYEPRVDLEEGLRRVLT